VKPTETESRQGLDRLITSLRSVAERALARDETLKSAPHFAPRRRLDETQAARKPVLTWQGHVQQPATPIPSEIGGS
jgi:glycine dehydrogenase subunit 2